MWALSGRPATGVGAAPLTSGTPDAGARRSATTAGLTTGSATLGPATTADTGGEVTTSITGSTTTSGSTTVLCTTTTLEASMDGRAVRHLPGTMPPSGVDKDSGVLRATAVALRGLPGTISSVRMVQREERTAGLRDLQVTGRRTAGLHGLPTAEDRLSRAIASSVATTAVDIPVGRHGVSDRLSLAASAASVEVSRRRAALADTAEAVRPAASAEAALVEVRPGRSAEAADSTAVAAEASTAEAEAVSTVAEADTGKWPSTN